MISCGEPSGDLYAGALAREILKREPNAEISGFGGARLREAGATLIGDFAGLTSKLDYLQALGVTALLRHLPPPRCPRGGGAARRPGRHRFS